MSDRTITVWLEGVYDLTPEEVWPDGVPEEFTAEDVVALMKGSGTIGNMMRDWNLGVSVSVYADNEKALWL
jgi:hypothetical protein